MLSNSRFWILAVGVTASVNIAGLTQLFVPNGSLQIIRIEQWYGFVAVFLLVLALMVSPLIAEFPRLPGRDVLIHARRAIGVLACYFAMLHSYITLAFQLGGIGGIRYLGGSFGWSILCGAVALGILMMLAATSFDRAIRVLRFANWKMLHRTVYLAGVVILVHIALVGPHFTQWTVLGSLTYLAIADLVMFELVRIYRSLRGRTSQTGART